jgi:hypothetical protein
MAFAIDQRHPKSDHSRGLSINPWAPFQLAALVGSVLIVFVTFPHLGQESSADAALTSVHSPQQTWFPPQYRAWKQSSAWKPQTTSYFWNRPSCRPDQTCLPVKVLTRDDCDLLSVSAHLVNPSTGQIMLATAKMPKVEAGQEQNLTLRWNLPPSQANAILAREYTRKVQIDTLADHQGNSSLQDLAVAHISTKLMPALPAHQSVTIKEIRCL